MVATYRYQNQASPMRTMIRDGGPMLVLRILSTVLLCVMSFFVGVLFAVQHEGFGSAGGAPAPDMLARFAHENSQSGDDPFNVELTPPLSGDTGNLPPEFKSVRTSFRPTKANGIDVAYFHMLQVRAGARFHRFGSTGLIHSQWQTIFWKTLERYVLGEVNTVCEAGLGSGHSGIALLTATTNTSWYKDGASFHSFDNGLDHEPHKKVAAYNYMNKVFGGRVVFHFGPQSSDEVRKVKASDPSFVCDIVHIDADHSKEGVMKDIDAMHAVSHNSTILFMDDYNIKGISDALNAKKNILEIDTVYTQEGTADWMIQSAESRTPRKVKKQYLVGHFKYSDNGQHR